MMFIFDTSAIAPIYVDEETSYYVRELIRNCFLNSIPIQCSELALYELGNVLVKVNSKETTDVMLRFRKIFPKPVISSPILENKSFKVSGEYGLTYYDSVHVALAIIENGTLITNDKRILKKFNASITPKEALDLILKNEEN